MRLKLSALMAIAVAGVGLEENVIYCLPVYGIFALLAFLADAKNPTLDLKKPKPSRYEQIELTTGIGWGSKQEELRAHLLGVWKPKTVVYGTDSADSDTGKVVNMNLERACYGGLLSSVAAAYLFWPATTVFLGFAAILQFFRTSHWSFATAMFVNSVISVVCLAYFYSPVMLALMPAILIFARKGDSL